MYCKSKLISKLKDFLTDKQKGALRRVEGRVFRGGRHY
jgi:hypothetical protein